MLEDAGTKRTKRAEERKSDPCYSKRGDIHDIGKNIVKVLLENSAIFDVIDLGKDVDPEVIVPVL